MPSHNIWTSKKEKQISLDIFYYSKILYGLNFWDITSYANLNSSSIVDNNKWALQAQE